MREGGTPTKVRSLLLRGRWQRRVGRQRKVGTMDKVKTSGGSDGANSISLNSHFVPPRPTYSRGCWWTPKLDPKEGISNIPFVLQNKKESSN